jgi:hypothetical protein
MQDLHSDIDADPNGATGTATLLSRPWCLLVRISDAVTLERSRLHGDNLLLRHPLHQGADILRITSAPQALNEHAKSIEAWISLQTSLTIETDPI